MNKGIKTTVLPIKKIKDIKAIKKILKSNVRDLALFTLGINTNLRASDIVKIKLAQVYDGITIQDELVLFEKKTGKKRRISLNRQVIDCLERLIESTQYSSGDYLFKSRKKGLCLTSNSLSRLVKGWCAEINLKGNYASHTLRKTWGYHQRVTFKMDIPVLMHCFNHSTQKQTFDYLCIQPEEIKSVYMNEL